MKKIAMPNLDCNINKRILINNGTEPLSSVPRCRGLMIIQIINILAHI